MQTLNGESQILVDTQNLISAEKTLVIRILHVDDDPSTLEISKLMLMNMGNFEIDQAINVDEALKKLQNSHYDCIISDYDMPQKNGLEFLQQLKKNKSETPFILFTGRGREEVAIKALNLGADGYYNKQNNPETTYGELAHGIRLATDRAKAKFALEQSEKRYHALMDQAIDSIFVHDIKGKIIDVNLKACQNLQYTKKELLSMNIREISPVASASTQMEQVWKKVILGQITTFESSQRRKDNSTFPIEVTLSPIVFDKETLVIAAIKDLTKQKEAKLLKSLKAFDERVIDSLADTILIVDPDNFKIINANKAALDQLKVKKEEVLGKTCFEVTHHSNVACQPPDDVCPIREVLETGKAVSVEHIHFDKFNKQSSVEVWAHPVLDAEGKTVIIHIAKDITEHRKVEKLLVENETKYRSLFLSMNEGVCLHELVYDKSGKAIDYKIIDVNPAFEQITEIKRRDALDELGSELYGLNEAPYLEIYSRVAETGKSESFNTYFAPMHKYFFISVFSPAKGKFATVFTDTTETKKKEIELSEALEALSSTVEEHEVLNEKLRVVGSLTRHDVRNKLSTITGYSYILKKKYADKADVVEALDKMVAAVQNSMKIFEFAKAYEQLGVEELVDVDFEKVVADAVDMFYDLPFKVVNECQGLIVHADSLLRHLLYNFIDNTRKHSQKATIARVHYQNMESGGVEVIYEDDGVGIPYENKLQLYNKGFSTGGGTGFGLFLSKKMMEVYGWNIQEMGEPGQGVKFVITIPLNCCHNI